MNLPEIITKVQNPNQKFQLDDKPLDFNLLDFWKWNQSDLIENRNRGILAEFIVMKALNIQSSSRLEWDVFDFITSEGIKIEVKSSAYIQAWKQNRYSSISFGIASSRKFQDDNTYSNEKARWADVYIFCLLDHKEQSTINPMLLDQWTFYIVSKKTLDEHYPEQKSIGLYYIDRIEHRKCKYNQLKQCFDEVCLSIK